MDKSAKRQRTDSALYAHENKSIPDNRAVTSVSSRALAITPVLPIISLFCDKTAIRASSSVNRVFNSLYKQPSSWRSLYTAHFGKLYFTEDFKAQYIAADLKKAAITISDCDAQQKIYIKLEEHLDAYPTKSWTFLYKAFLASSGRRPSKKPSTVYALDAFRLGDLNAGLFLVNEFRSLMVWENFAPTAELKETLDLFLKKNKGMRFNTEVAILYSIMCSISQDKEERENLKALALLHFFQARKGTAANNEKFIAHFLMVFKLLEIIPEAVANHLNDDETAPKLSNALEVIMFFLTYNYPDFHDKNAVFDWIKRLADEGNAAAAYHYADYLKENAETRLEAKYYFLQSLKGGENRAIGGIHYFSIKNRHLISKYELIALLTPLAWQGNELAITSLAREVRGTKDWHTNLFKLWIMQVAVCAEPQFNQIYNFMLKKSSSPEGVYVRCALAFIHLVRDKNVIAAKGELMPLLDVDNDLVKKYMEAGKQANLLTAECENFYVNCLSVAKTKKIGVEKLSAYNLRPRPY